jgi:hypothetical protein
MCYQPLEKWYEIIGDKTIEGLILVGLYLKLAYDSKNKKVGIYYNQ